MRLSLSHCKKYVILPVVKKAEDAGQHFFNIQLLQWSSRNLKASKLKQDLVSNLGRVECEEGSELVSVDLVSNSKYLLLKIRNPETEGKASMNYHIYDTSTGLKVLTVDNQLCSNIYAERPINKLPKDKLDEDQGREDYEKIRPDTLSCIDLLIERGEDLGDQAAEEEEEEYSSGSSGSGGGDDDSDYGSYGDEGSQASGSGGGSGSGSDKASKRSEGAASGSEKGSGTKSHHSGSKAADSAHGSAINDSGEGEGSGGGSAAPDNEEHGSAVADSDGTDKEGGDAEAEEVKHELKLVFFFVADFSHKNEEQWVMG